MLAYTGVCVCACACYDASFQVYRIVNEAIINLLEKFFEFSLADAESGLDIYKTYVEHVRLYASCASCVRCSC